MNEPSLFDHRPDPELGAALREALSGADDAGFVRRVMARVPRQAARLTGWDVLGGWARHGLAAAAILLFLLGAWLGRVTSSAPPEEVAVAEQLDPAMVLASYDPAVVDAELVLVGEQ